jgi:hypothetical protein
MRYDNAFVESTRHPSNPPDCLPSGAELFKAPLGGIRRTRNPEDSVLQRLTSAVLPKACSLCSRAFRNTPVSTLKVSEYYVTYNK